MPVRTGSRCRHNPSGSLQVLSAERHVVVVQAVKAGAFPEIVVVVGVSNAIAVGVTRGITIVISAAGEHDDAGKGADCDCDLLLHGPLHRGWLNFLRAAA